MDPNRLKDKNILITGAAQGMGATNAEHFAEQGANICLGDINLDGAREVAERINKAGNGKAIAVKLDVTSREDNAAAAQATVDEFGMINVGVFNAGINKPRFFMDIDEGNWDTIMNVNTRAMWLGMQEVARHMIRQGPQEHVYKLINVGSVASRTPLYDVTVYCCSKYACLALTHCGAKALWEHNITVNGYAPGIVHTELWEQLDKDLVEIGMFREEGQSMDHVAKTLTTMKKLSFPDDVKGTAAYLVSHDSDYMTGQMIQIDGGWVIQ